MRSICARLDAASCQITLTNCLFKCHRRGVLCWLQVSLSVQGSRFTASSILRITSTPNAVKQQTTFDIFTPKLRAHLHIIECSSNVPACRMQLSSQATCTRYIKLPTFRRAPHLSNSSLRISWSLKFNIFNYIEITIEKCVKVCAFSKWDRRSSDTLIPTTTVLERSYTAPCYKTVDVRQKSVMEDLRRRCVSRWHRDKAISQVRKISVVIHSMLCHENYYPRTSFPWHSFLETLRLVYGPTVAARITKRFGPQITWTATILRLAVIGQRAPIASLLC